MTEERKPLGARPASPTVRSAGPGPATAKPTRPPSQPCRKVWPLPLEMGAAISQVSKQGNAKVSVVAGSEFHSNACRLGPGSLLHDRKEICLALRTTAATIELGSLFDRKRHMMYIAVNLRCYLQGDRLSTNHARDRTANDHLLARDQTCHFALLTDYNFSGQHVTLDLAVDLKDTTTDDP